MCNVNQVEDHTNEVHFENKKCKQNNQDTQIFLKTFFIYIVYVNKNISAYAKEYYIYSLELYLIIIPLLIFDRFIA